MRIRRTSVLALVLVAAALVVGCGGSEVPPDEVPGGPVTLTVPEDAQLGGGDDSGSSDSSSDSSDTSTDDTTDDTATTDDGTSTAPSTTTDDTSGGTTAPAPATTDDTSGGTTAPPTDDSAAAPDTGGTGGTSEFCEQNAGAC